MTFWILARRLEDGSWQPKRLCLTEAMALATRDWLLMLEPEADFAVHRYERQEASE